MLFAGWFHYHKAAPKLAWFQDVESMLNHHLAGLLGLGSLSWAGHQIHVSLPINQFLDAGVDPKEIPLPHEFILNRDLLAQLYPSFAEGATPFFNFKLVQIRRISDFSRRTRSSNRRSMADRYCAPSFSYCYSFPNRRSYV